MMASEPDLLDRLAALLLYPGDNHGKELSACIETAAGSGSAAGGHLRDYVAAIDDYSLADLQELFVRRFEHNPKTALEVGWHIYGERYERGALMAMLRRTLAQAGVEENGELPDHASHVLQLIPRVEPGLAVRLANTLLLPALDSIEQGLGDNRAPFVHLLHAVRVAAAEALQAKNGRLLKKYSRLDEPPTADDVSF